MFKNICVPAAVDMYLWKHPEISIELTEDGKAIDVTRLILANMYLMGYVRGKEETETH